MPLLQPADLEKMDYVQQAQPFVQVATKTANETVEYVHQAQPFTVAQTIAVTDTTLGFMMFFM